MKKYIAEFVGTFWLVLGGCGSAVLAAALPDAGIDLLGVSLALTVLAITFTIGHVSGCHLNPAVSIGLWIDNRFSTSQLFLRLITQAIGGIAGAFVLYLFISGQISFELTGFVANSFNEASLIKYNMIAMLVCGVVITMMFLIINIGATDKRALALIAIGLGLTLIHLISLPVNNASVSPVASTAISIFEGDLPLRPLWLFWVAPIAWAIITHKEA